MAETIIGKEHMQKVWKAESIQEAIDLKKRFQDQSTYIAGGTLLQLQREQGAQLPPNLIRLDRIPKLREIEQDEDRLYVGAYVSLTECQTNPAILSIAPLLAESVKEVASPAVRNRGTIGGNIAYGVGDTIPALLALDADISWISGNQMYTAKLWDYLQHQPDRNAIITTIHLKKQMNSQKQIQYYRKVGRRESFIPSLVTVAICCSWNEQNRIDFIRLAAAGGTSAPVRLESCEAYLYSNELLEENLGELFDMMMTEYRPISDPFVTSQYKQQVAANLIASVLRRYI